MCNSIEFFIWKGLIAAVLSDLNFGNVLRARILGARILDASTRVPIGRGNKFDGWDVTGYQGLPFCGRY